MKTRRLVKALKRVRLKPGDMLVVAPSVDIALLAATRIHGRHHPELKGTLVIRAWPNEIASAPRAESAPE